MDGYDAAEYCPNGHFITDEYHDGPAYREDFCTKCGGQTLIACQDCGVEIRGDLRESSWYGSPPRPAFCHACGHAYPWTSGALEAARELIDDSEDLTDDEREQLSETLDDLIADSPKTEVAGRRFRKLVAKADIGGGLRSIMVAVATEAAKKPWGSSTGAHLAAPSARCTR